MTFSSIAGIDLIGCIICLFNTVCFSFAAYFTFSFKAKRRKENITLALLWTSVAIYFFVHSLVILTLPFSFKLSSGLLYISYFFLFLQVTLGALYVIIQATKKPWLRTLAAISLLSLLGILAFYFLTQSSPTITEAGEPYLDISGGFPIGYIAAFLAVIIFVMAVALLWRDFRAGAISWHDLHLFYGWYALVLYISISLIRALHFLPYPWYIEVFYIFVPYLMYLSRRESSEAV